MAFVFMIYTIVGAQQKLNSNCDRVPLFDLAVRSYVRYSVGSWLILVESKTLVRITSHEIVRNLSHFST